MLSKYVLRVKISILRWWLPHLQPHQVVGLSTCTFHMLLKHLLLKMIPSSPKISFAHFKSRGFSSCHSPYQTPKVIVSFDSDPLSCSCAVSHVQKRPCHVLDHPAEIKHIPRWAPCPVEGQDTQTIRQQCKPCVMSLHYKYHGDDKCFPEEDSSKPRGQGGLIWEEEKGKALWPALWGRKRRKVCDSCS